MSTARVLMISKALVSAAYHGKLREIARLGVDLHLVVPPAWGDLPLEVSSAPDYAIHTLPIAWNGQHHSHYYRGLDSILRSVEPCIVHIDEEHYSFVTFQAIRSARRVGAKSLFFTWQNIYKRYPPPFSFVERYNFRHAAAAIAGNSDAERVLTKKGFGKRTVCIPQFGVDPELFRSIDPALTRRELGLPLDVPVVGFAGRLVEEKGIGVLMSAVGAVQPTPWLLIVGSGPLREKLHSMAEESGVRQRMVLVSGVESMKMPEVLNCMDCLVLPSLTRANWKEQFGRVLIEAMACEIPVVGSDSGEIPHVIGKAGCVVPEGSVEALAAVLEQLLSDRARRDRLAASGRDRVLRRFTHRRIAEATLALYSEVLDA